MFLRATLIAVVALFGAALVVPEAAAQPQGSSPAPSRKALRMGVLVIPLDRPSESRVFELERQASTALRQRGIPLIPAETIFGLSRRRETSEAYDLAMQGFRAAKEGFRQKDYLSTFARLGPIIDEIRSEADSLPGPKPLCEAYALWGATAYAIRNMGVAERAMRAHLSLCPEERLPETEFIRGLNGVRSKVSQQGGPKSVLGSLELITRPPGARIFVDGEEKGFTPMVVGALRPGPHLIHLERPGYERKARVFEIYEERQGLRIELRPSARQKKWEDERAELAALLALGRSSDRFTQIGRTLGLGQAVFITVRSQLESNALTLVLAHVRMYDGRILGLRRVTLQEHELPPSGNELSRLVSQLVVPVDVIAPDGDGASEDPLDTVSGTEDW